MQCVKCEENTNDSAIADKTRGSTHMHSTLQAHV